MRSSASLDITITRLPDFHGQTVYRMSGLAGPFYVSKDNPLSIEYMVRTIITSTITYGKFDDHWRREV